MRLVFLVGDLAHFAESCTGTGEVVLELEDFDLHRRKHVSNCSEVERREIERINIPAVPSRAP